MNKVTLLNATCERENIVNLFAKFANKYGTPWTNRLGANPNWDECIDDWRNDLSQYDYKTLVLATKETFNKFPNFPPTFGQFENLCKKYSGFLQPHDAIRMMMARDFSHPIVKMMYDIIGSWTLSNGKEDDILEKSKDAYKDAESEFMLYPEKCWAQLEVFNAKPKELPPPPKIPTVEERKSFRERLAEYQQKIEDAKLECKGLPYKEFDENKIRPGARDFDQAVYNEFREYLISIPETKVMILPVNYMYQRRKFLNMIEQQSLLKELGYNPNAKVEPEEPVRRYDKPTRVYQTWGE